MSTPFNSRQRSLAAHVSRMTQPSQDRRQQHAHMAEERRMQDAMAAEQRRQARIFRVSGHLPGTPTPTPRGVPR